MKNRLLATIALCGATAFSATPLWAAEWADPEVVTTTLNLEEGGSYYFYLRQADMFLVNGNSYNTQTSLGAEGKIIKIAKVTDAGLTDWALEMPDAPANNGGKPKYLYTKDGQNAYVDYNMEGSYLWKITENADGKTYRIKITDGDPRYGVEADGGIYANGYLGWDGLKTETGTMANTIIRPFVNPASIGYENAAIDWEVVSEEDYAVYNAKKSLKAVLEYADKVGFTDYAKFEAVYKNSSATEDEVKAATAELQKLADDYYYSQVSEDNPLDMTLKITNANFPNGDKSGWDNNMDMSRTDATDYYYNEDNEEMFRFAEKWVSGGNRLGDVYIQQTLKDMPEGKYKLTADVIGFQQNGNQLATGIYLFANGGLGDITKETGTKNFNEENRPIAHKDSVEFAVLGDGILTFGFRTVSTTANWVGVDNFKLTYYGATDNLAEATVTETRDKLSQLWQDLITELGSAHSKAIEEKYNKALEDVENSLNGSADRDSLINLNLRLLALMDEVERDVDAYSRVGNVLQNAQLATIYCGDQNAGYLPYAEIVDKFTKTNAYYEMIATQVSECTFVPDSINTIQANMTRLFKEELLTLVQNKEVDDLYGLLASPDFTNNDLTGWKGNITTGGNEPKPITENNVAENYQGGAGAQSFDVYQQLENLPNGAYTVTMKGFCRPGNFDSFTPDWQTDPAQAVQAYLYGNTSSVQVKNILTEGSDEPYISKDDGSTDDRQTAAVEGKYFANNRASAEVAFARGQYVNTLQFVVTDGVLRFGVKMNTENGPAGNWTVFDEFRVKYNGENAEAYLTALSKLFNEVAEYALPLQIYEIPATLDVINELSDALAEAEDLINGSSTDVAKITASMDRLVAARAAAEESVAIVAELSTLITVMYDKCQELEENGYNSDGLNIITEEADEKYTNGELASVAEVNDYILKINEAVTKAIMAVDAATASKETPADVTALIVNPGFSMMVDGVETNTGEGWIMEKDGGNNAANYSEYEFWNNNSFKLYQKLYGLNPGFYKLSCNGYYRAGGYRVAAAAHRDGVEKLNAMLYAGTYFVPLMSIIECGTSKPLASDNVNVADSLRTPENPVEAWYIPNQMKDAQPAFANGDYLNEMFFEVTEADQMIEIGVKKDEHIGDDWTIFDSFKLLYYGSGEENRPDAVESVEEAAEVVSTTYYDMTGAQIAKPTKRNSLYIRRDVLSNGKVKSATFILR